MELYRFELASVRAQLAHLPPRCRVAFALACATRIASLASPSVGETTKEALQLAERFAHGQATDLKRASQLLADLEASAIDDDAQSAAIYALAALSNGDVESPSWAAECAYNARDSQAQETMSFSTYTKEVEAQLLADTRVQEELRLQANDLRQLQQGVAAIAAVLSRAQLGAA